MGSIHNLEYSESSCLKEAANLQIVLALILRKMKPFITTLLFSFSLVMLAQPRLQKVDINEEISMAVPTDLKRSTPVMQRTTSPSIANFYSQDGQVDLGINMAQLRWSANDTELLSQFYKANILNLYDNVQMHDEGMKEINGRHYIVFEFSGTIVDEGNAFSETKQKSDYTYIMYNVSPQGVLIFRFTSPRRIRSRWQKTVREMMASVEISEKKKK